MTLPGRGRRRQFAASQNGFTLTELMMTVVILGVLAAIALPSFANHRKDASDATTKALVHAGTMALQSYATEHEDYNATKAEILDMAPELSDASSWTLTSSVNSFTISITSPASHVFTVARTLTTPAVRTCTSGPDPAGSGGCAADGTW
ncbi:MAG: type pilus assembly protein PilA [Solirubrobacteraceae bacterium]|jgi:type IV pilus assembly protein PilE|nr:type pilus assembly protein PilA [Solirubrobacteraceae bacterium]